MGTLRSSVSRDGSIRAFCLAGKRQRYHQRERSDRFAQSKDGAAGGWPCRDFRIGEVLAYGVGEKELQRDTWFRLTCIVVHRKDQTKIIESLRGKILTDPDSFPEIELHSGYFYLGEYHWHPEIREFDRWSSHADRRPFAVPIRPTVASYVCESGGYDYSIDRTISIKMPAPWLSKGMGLRLSRGRSLIFVNSDGRETFYDPSVVESGPAAALVDRDAFLRMLDRQDLSAIWVIAGEKNAYGGSDAGLGFGGRLLHTTLYHIDGDGFARYLHTERLHPDQSQLEEFFGDAPIPPGIITRSTVLES